MILQERECVPNSGEMGRFGHCGPKTAAAYVDWSANVELYPDLDGCQQKSKPDGIVRHQAGMVALEWFQGTM